MKRKMKPARIAVSRIPGDDIRMKFEIGFDPFELGVRRTKRFWKHLALMIAAILEPNEIREFLDKFKAAAIDAEFKGLLK